MFARKLPFLSLILVTALSVACSDNDDDDNTNLPEVPDDVIVTNPLQDSSPIDEKIQSILAENPVPGMAVAIISNPQSPVIWSKGYGFADIETDTKVTENTSFWLASVSKAVMGTAIMIANEKGSLNLDDDVRELVSTSGGFDIGNPEARAITLNNLASHTSGVVDADAYSCAYYINNDDGTQTMVANAYGADCPEDGPTTLSGFLAAYLDADGIYYDATNNFSSTVPGDTFEYSNIGAGLAGYTLELATGQTLAEFAAENIFIPLGMINTSWRYGDLDPTNVAKLYQSGEDGELVALPNYELATWPDGGLRSSASDMARFLATIMNAGKFGQTDVNILQESSVTQMHTPIIDDYGFFWEVNGTSVEYSGEEHALIGHNGADPGVFSYLYFDPEQEIGIVILFTGEEDSSLIQELAELVSLMFESGELLE